MTEELHTQYRPMQAVKRHFFAMRNGVVVDVLRKGGSPFRYIFGLNLPQLMEAASMFGPDRMLAEELWANSTTRESMLLAPMIMPREGFGHEDAAKWASEVTAIEVADVLCHRLLRHLDFAPELAVELAGPDRSDMERYVGARLAINLMYADASVADKVADCLSVTPGPLAAAVLRDLKVRMADLNN